MSKYKLVKIYPKSPPLGTIVEIGNDGYLTYRMRNDYNQEMTSIHESVLTDYSEFWEEIVENDYEILSLRIRRSINHEIIDTTDYSDNYIKGLLACEGNSAYSIKRLSDDEVFTIGDKITLNQIASPARIIKSINITHDDYIIFKHNVGAIFLKDAVKVKQPLFTTEDGVDIYEGEEYFEVITPDFHNKPCIWNIIPNKTRGNIIYDQVGNKRNGRLWFSTKESAEEYILINKPCLSVADIYNYFNGQWSKCSNIVHLKELVKSKL